MLGKHTLDAGLGQFVNQVLPWVCWKRDVYYEKVDARGTSQECPDCGIQVRKALSVRVHQCPECGSTKPRDVAAAQVICTRGQRGIESSTPLGLNAERSRSVENACGVKAAGAEVTQSSWRAVKQEIFGATQGISQHTH